MLSRNPERSAKACDARAQQYRTRAEQLDREGKFFRANMERTNAERYETAAAKARAKLN